MQTIMGTRDQLPLALGFILFSFIFNSALIVPFIDLLYKFKLTRRVEGGKHSKSLFDKYHDIKAGTPTGGGILIVIVVVLHFAILFPLIDRLGVFIQASYRLPSELFIILFTFISFGLLGFLDDIIKVWGKPKEGRLGYFVGMSRKVKLGLQFVLAGIIAFLLYNNLGIRFIHLPYFGIINLGIFYFPFAIFVIVFFANAFNFTDGLDGLASGLLMIYLFAFIVIAAGNLDTPLLTFMALWLGAIIAFLYFNVWPARIFLGDTGALSFGAMIAVIGLLTGNIASLFVIGGLFVIEALSSIIQILGWKILKRRIFPIAPIHHTFLTYGWEEPKIVMRAWLAAIMLAILGLWLARI
ncbi:MAG TPA: phospho-N-acetylmuramoyl-pentapeptide-transferase [Candidatus Saccharimonadales bacterium]|nr:phospho-N-acetylmuramoyl-pentapeptide-transferase [Candidatus Saccharimonadales bacterium]